RPVAPFPDTCAPVDVERRRAFVTAHTSIAATPPYTRGLTRSLWDVLRNGCGISTAGRSRHPGGPGRDVRSPAAPPVLSLHVSDWGQHVCTPAEGLALRCVTDHSRGEGVCVDRSKEMRERLPVDEESQCEQGQQDHLQTPTEVARHYYAVAHDKQSYQENDEYLLEEEANHHCHPSQEDSPPISGVDTDEQEDWRKEKEKKERNLQNNQGD